MTIPTLDEIVLSTLDFFIETPPPVFDISSFSLPFVVGSGNAINTGKILFSGKSAVFADESNYKSIAEAYEPVIEKGLITDAVVISASGEKDSVWEIELSKKMGLKTTLLTCKPQSSAAKIADQTISYKSIAEPYTYNTSTYLGMILSVTGERAQQIKDFITAFEIRSGFTDYASFAFVTQDRFLDVTPMIIIKRDELFGPHLSIRAYTEGHARHAKFVHPWDDELVIGLGVRNEHFGKSDHRWDVALPDWANYGSAVAISYYICGLIQKAKPDYFTQHIEAYCTDYGPKAYGKPGTFEIMVPGNS